MKGDLIKLILFSQAMAFSFKNKNDTLYGPKCLVVCEIVANCAALF
jgi:hypothetical protein